MMSEDLEGLFDPVAASDQDVLGTLEFLDQKVRCTCVSVTYKKDETIYRLSLKEDFDLHAVVGRDWTDFVLTGVVKSMTVKKEDIVSLKISSKAIKLRFRRHTYGQG